MQLPRYKQRLKGTFVARVIPRGQCGFTVGLQEFAYNVTIRVNALDENGWIVDNHDLDKTISQCYCDGHWQASCEDLAGGLLTAVAKLAGQRAEEITVGVGPNEFAELSVEWQRGDDLPIFVPRFVPDPAENAPQATATGKPVA